MNLHRQSFLVGCAAGVAIVSGCFAAVQGLRNQQQIRAAAELKAAQRDPARAVVSIDGAPALGSVSAPVTLVEFSDFQCPFCKQFHDLLFPQLKRAYIDHGLVRFVHKDLPLPFHSQSLSAALGARCAAEQGGYWRFYETLFSRQSCLECQGVASLASQAGLHGPKFARCLISGRYRPRVKADADEARALAISGTPTFVLGLTGPRQANGRPSPRVVGTVIVGARPWPEFQGLIKAALAKQP